MAHLAGTSRAYSTRLVVAMAGFWRDAKSGSKIKLRWTQAEMEVTDA